MPYIKLTDRDRMDPYSDGFPVPANTGELNYSITILCQQYFAKNGGRYQQINDIIGALEGTKLEFYRRLVAPYEDAKIAENGDVYSG